MKKILAVFFILLLVSVSALAMKAEKMTYDTNTSYMGGYPDGTFRPDGTITRAEAATVFSRLLYKNVPSKGKTSFSDALGHWSENSVASLETLGILEIFNGKFSPDKPITRAEFVALATSVFETKKIKDVSFSDVDSSCELFDYIMIAGESGLVGGYTDGTFRPDNTLTRAEAVSIINRALGISADSNIFGQNYSRLNRFTDIQGHWARYNILVASNSNVGNYILPTLGKSCRDKVTFDGEVVTLESMYGIMEILSDGTLYSLYDKSAKRELIGESSYFAVVIEDGKEHYPESLVLDGENIVVCFNNGSAATFKTVVKDAYISFEVADFEGNADRLVFANLSLSKNGSVIGVSLDSRAVTHNAPNKTTLSFSATALSEFGIVGAKYGFVIAPDKYHLTALEVMAKDTDIERSIFAASRFDSEEERLVNTNYYIGTNADHETLFASLHLYKSVGIDMLSFHKGAATFRQGDFVFPNQSLKENFEKVIVGYLDKLGLYDTNPYSYYFTKEGSELFDEEFSLEFERIDEFVLKENFTRSARSYTFDSDISGEYYIVVDDELIKAEFQNGKAVILERGAAGSTRDEHAAGTTAVVIDIIGNGAHNFKALVSDVLRENGILSGLHTYAFYIDPECKELLSDPEWQKQLEVHEEYTLSEDITSYATTLPTFESLDGAERGFNFRSQASEFVLIGEELIKIDSLAIGDNKFEKVVRGYHGTKISAHKAGEKIYRIEAYYGGIAPKMGSELFYHVARLTGNTYRDGGFDMVYFDAIDGVRWHIGDEIHSEYYAYYTTEFMRETLEWCGEKPITEVYLPMQYLTHSYTPAYDYANRGYKEYIRAHAEYNKTYLNSYFFATLGWYNFYPQNTPDNTIFEYQHTDDIDFLGATAIAYDYSMVFSNLDTYRSVPKNRANIDRFVIYDKLRKSGYFSEDVKKELREGEFEYSLVKRDDGGFGIVEKHYVKGRINDTSDPERNTLNGNNPFNKQTPFVRIEADYSSSGDDSIVLIESDGMPPKEAKYTFTTPINAAGRNALFVRVKSNGTDGAVCISLESPVVSVHNQIDFVIPLDFEGEKDFVLVATDTFLYAKEWFSHWEARDTYNFKLYRGPVDFSSISAVSVYLHGDVSGVCLSDVRLTKHTDSPIVSPTISLAGGGEITFDTVIRSGEYLEYDGKEALVYDSIGRASKVGVIKGSLTVDGGEFEVRLTSSKGNVINRAKLTLSFEGDDITR